MKVSAHDFIIPINSNGGANTKYKFRHLIKISFAIRWKRNDFCICKIGEIANYPHLISNFWGERDGAGVGAVERGGRNADGVFEFGKIANMGVIDMRI